MRVSSRFLGALALGVLFPACTASPGGDWPSQVLLGTTPLGDSYADFLSARYAGMVNEPEAASVYYANAWDRSPEDAELLDRAAVSLLLSGDADTAAQIARSADTEILADAPFALLTLASIEIGAGRERQALRLLEAADLGAMEGIARVLRAWAKSDRSLEAALSELEASAEEAHLLAPHDDCLRGMMAAAAGDTERALEYFNAGFAVCSDTPPLAAAHLSTVAVAEGPQSARDLLARMPIDTQDSLAVGAIARQLMRGDEISPVEISTREGAAIGLFVAANAVGAGTSGQLGAVFFQMMRAIDPESDLALVTLAESHYSLDRYAAAREYADQVDRESVYASRALWQRARSMIADEQNAEAFVALRQLASQNLNRELSLRVGDAFRLLEAPREAEQIYTRLIEIDAGAEPDWRPLFGRAAAYTELENWEAAEADLLAALEIDPDQPEILNFLGYGWINQGLNVDAGFDLIRRAIAQRPQSGYIVDSLGWAHYRLGQYEDAARELERAAELTPDEAEIIDHLGDAYWRTGRRLEAGFEWRRALTLNPGEELADRIREKLDGGLPDDVAGGMAEAAPAHR